MFFVGSLHFMLIFTGAKLSDASTMIIVNQLYVPFSALIAMVSCCGETRAAAALGGHRARAFAGVVVFSLDASVVVAPSLGVTRSWWWMRLSMAVRHGAVAPPERA